MIKRPPFRLAAFDLDGTLLDGPSAISPATADAVRQLVALGVVVAPATARFQPISTVPFARAGLSVPSISAAGADIRAADATVIAQRAMTASIADELGRLCDRAGWRATVSTPDRNYQRANVPPPWAANPPPFLTPVTALAGLDLRAALSFLIAVEPGEECRREIEQLGAGLTVHEAVRHDGRGLLTITAPGVDKGSGLRALCKALGMSEGEVIAFGDSAVDVPLFRAAGHSVAMPAAPPAVRDAASIVAPDGGDAVAAVLRTVFGLTDPRD